MNRKEIEKIQKKITKIEKTNNEFNEKIKKEIQEINNLLEIKSEEKKTPSNKSKKDNNQLLEED